MINFYGSVVFTMGILFPGQMVFILKRPWYQGSWGQHGAHLGPTGPRWAPCWPHELCYLGGPRFWIHYIWLLFTLICLDKAAHDFAPTKSIVMHWWTVHQHRFKFWKWRCMPLAGWCIRGPIDPIVVALYQAHGSTLSKTRSHDFEKKNNSPATSV